MKILIFVLIISLISNGIFILTNQTNLSSFLNIEKLYTQIASNIPMVFGGIITGVIGFIVAKLQHKDQEKARKKATTNEKIEKLLSHLFNLNFKLCNEIKMTSKLLEDALKTHKSNLKFINQNIYIVFFTHLEQIMLSDEWKLIYPLCNIYMPYEYSNLYNLTHENICEISYQASKYIIENNVTNLDTNSDKLFDYYIKFLNIFENMKLLKTNLEKYIIVEINK